MVNTNVVKLKLEGGSEGRLPKLMDDTVERAVELFDEGRHDGYPPKSFETYLRQTSDISVSERQLQDIVDRIWEKHGDAENTDDHLGLYVSALVSSSKHSKFRIETPKPLNNLGYRLPKGKTLIIGGDAGRHLGSLNAGQIIVKGDAGDYIGWEMKEGQILVEGNAGMYVGCYMRSGEIQVRGQADPMVGINMTGGFIRVGKLSEGEGISAAYQGGEIWEGNKKVRPKET
ncbi:MAG: hypothetical protein V1921_06620 [Candidatus Altiarchaeota archaeon]